MNTIFILFLFSVSTNLLIVLLAGIDEFTGTQPAGNVLSDWLIMGLQLLFWGWIAYGIRQFSSLIPMGKPFFLPVFVGCFILLRSAIVAVLRRTTSIPFSDTAIAKIDSIVSKPMLLIAVLFIGYGSYSPIETLMIIVSIWAGLGLAAGIFIAIRRRIELEPENKLMGTSGVLLLSAALIALIITGLDQAFISRLIS